MKNKLYITNILFILFLIVLSSFSLLIFNPQITNEPYTDFENKQYPYIDSACKNSKQEIINYVEELDNFIGSTTLINFYEHPSNFVCQGRPVISNGNYESPIDGEQREIAIGIGTNTDIDNLQFVGRWCLIFFILINLFNKFKMINIKLVSLNVKTFLIFIGILIIYNVFVFSSIINALSNVSLQLIIGNYLVFLIYKNFDFENFFKALITISIFPLFFSDSNLTFFWLLLLTSINCLFENKITINKGLVVIFSILTTSYIFNVSQFVFEKSKSYGDWILFSNHRHKGGIIDVNNGAQSLAYLIDLVVLIFIFYVMFKNFKYTNSSLEECVTDSLIYGFIIWFLGYFVSQVNPILNYSILKIFGLNENIDTIASVQPDGINWRGLTSSHELTGFWLLIIFCLLVGKLLKSKKLIYLFLLVPVAFSISWNSQRTTLILAGIFLIYLFLTSRTNPIYLIIVFVIISGIIVSNESTSERFLKRINDINFDFTISSSLQTKIGDTYNRIEKYDYSFEERKYNFNELNHYSEFFELEIGTSNNFVVNSVGILIKSFGREYQWFRFLHFTDFTQKELLIGNGPGQNHQLLVEIIEKPHSLYLSTIFQFGILGVSILISMFLVLLSKFLTNPKNYILLLGLYFFIVGIKAEMIFTHNQIVFFIIFMYLCFFSEKEKEEGRKKT